MTAAAQIAEALDRLLAPPDGLRANLIAPDDRDELPSNLCEALDAHDLCSYYVPAELNGRLRSYEELAAIVAAIATRDAGLAIAHAKTYLGASTIWIGGSEALRRQVAALVLGGGRVALGLTERDHGADLLATGTRATPDANGYTLTGEKWLINNATRGDAIVVLARTAAADGPRSLTLFFLDKRALDRTSWRPLPRVRTHGMRGAEISGIAFDGARIPAASVVGEPGLGLELTLRAFQITRTVIAALSLGVGDAVLRRAIALVCPPSRSGAAADPHAAAIITRAYADLWMAACAVAAGARALHVVPAQMSLVSAVTKAAVPMLVERVIAELAALIGRRRAVRLDTADARLHKAIRDSAIMGVFDGSTVVTLHTVSLQLASRRTRPDEAAAQAAIAAIADSRQPLPTFTPDALTLASRGRNAVVDAFPAAVRALGESPPHVGSHRRVVNAAGRIASSLARLQSGRAGDAPRERFERTAEAVEYARRYVRIHTAAAAFHAWRTLPDPGTDAVTEIAAIALHRTADDLDGMRRFPSATVAHGVCSDLVRRCEDGRPLLPPPFV